MNNQERQTDKKLLAPSDMLPEKLSNKTKYKKKRTQLMLKSNEADLRIEEIGRDKTELPKNILRTIKEPSAAYERFEASNMAGKRKILERFFEKLELKGKELQYVIRYTHYGTAKN